MQLLARWLPVALCLCFLGAIGYLQRGRALRAENDFVQLYTGARLAGTPDLYSREANLDAVQATLGFTMESVVYTRPPFYAALLQPLGLLPYRAAYAVFSLGSILSLLWFVVRFSRECNALPLFAALSLPALAALIDGQDTLYLVGILGLAVLLMRGKHDVLAGMVLSLMAIKFHLFLLVPVTLILGRRWRVLAGGAMGSAGLTLLSVVVGGWRVIPDYIRVLRDPWINFDAKAMPNLHGLSAVLGWGTPVELTLVALVVAVFAWVAWRSTNIEFALAAALVAGLLISFHSNVTDDALLLVAFVLIAGSQTNAALTVAATLILTPVPYFASFSGAPYSAVLPLALLVLMGLLGWVVAGREKAALPADLPGGEGVPA